MELVMKGNALILGVGLAPLTASTAHAQESSRLSLAICGRRRR
jgi:hypothetical protein